MEQLPEGRVIIVLPDPRSTFQPCTLRHPSDFSMNSISRVRMRVVVLTVAATAALSVSASPISAMRHLKLVKAFPSADTVLAKSPDAVRLWLSEQAEVPATKIALTTAAGVAIATAPVTHADGKDAPLVALIPKPLANGAYKVTWKTMSKDGHVVNGTIAFTVGAAK